MPLVAAVEHITAGLPERVVQVLVTVVIQHQRQLQQVLQIKVQVAVAVGMPLAHQTPMVAQVVPESSSSNTVNR
jgi:hypothetical protein